MGEDLKNPVSGKVKSIAFSGIVTGNDTGVLSVQVQQRLAAFLSLGCNLYFVGIL